MRIIFSLCFVCLFLIINSIDSDFEVIHRTNFEANKYIDYEDKLLVQVDISFGSKNDKFKAIVDIDKYCLTVLGNEIKDFENLKKFILPSDTFKTIKNVSNIYSEYIYKGVFGQDSVTLGESEKIDNLKFFVITELNLSPIYTSASIGLYPEEKTEYYGLSEVNILDQLKNASVINKKTWYLDFNDLNKGKFVIGKLPHEVDGNKFNEKNSLSFYMSKNIIYTSFYSIEFNEIYYGNLNNYNNRIQLNKFNVSIISLSSNLIYSTYEYFEFIKDKIFTKKLQDNICHQSYYGEEFLYYYCDKDKFDISEVDNLNFYIRDKNMTFTLESKDLFYENNNYLYYMVIFPISDNINFKWIFGLSFLKKYTLAFDRGEKLVYYYNSNKENTNNDGSNSSPSSGKYITIIVCLCAVFICSTGFFVYYILKIKPRKKKANELDEGFDYETQNNEDRKSVV
mgnify:CR=1 FL=1